MICALTIFIRRNFGDVKFRNLPKYNLELLKGGDSSSEPLFHQENVSKKLMWHNEDERDDDKEDEEGDEDSILTQPEFGENMPLSQQSEGSATSSRGLTPSEMEELEVILSQNSATVSGG